ncbi:alkaline shock response membrane anchor protein AmaP [Janibacter terrae]|uniref:Alkaline shock response membrane anchor protein AmaP n=1 Tax=Janibacter terrae TaxID=103817 RepID=A0ABZ2FDP9_9MICO
MNPSQPPSHPRPAVLAAAGVCLLQVLTLLVTAGLYALELTRGDGEDPSTASMTMVVCIIFAILLAVLASAWFKGASWPRTPTIVWNVLLLPAAWTLATSSGLWFGLGLAVLALVGIAAALLTPVPELPDRAL